MDTITPERRADILGRTIKAHKYRVPFITDDTITLTPNKRADIYCRDARNATKAVGCTVYCRDKDGHEIFCDECIFCTDNTGADRYKQFINWEKSVLT